MDDTLRDRLQAPITRAPGRPPQLGGTQAHHEDDPALTSTREVVVTAGGPTPSDPTAALVESLQFCGMQTVKSLVFPGIGPGIDPKIVEKALKLAREAGKGF